MIKPVACDLERPYLGIRIFVFNFPVRQKARTITRFPCPNICSKIHYTVPSFPYGHWVFETWPKISGASCRLRFTKLNKNYHLIDLFYIIVLSNFSGPISMMSCDAGRHVHASVTSPKTLCIWQILRFTIISSPYVQRPRCNWSGQGGQPGTRLEKQR